MSNQSNDIPEGFKMTELGLLPEEWEAVSLRRIATINKVAIDPQSYPDESFEYYSIPAYQISNSPIVENGCNIHSQKLVVNNGTVLFGKLNPRVPKVWLVHSLSNRRKLASTEFIPLMPIENLIVSVFLYYSAWSSYVMPKAQELVSGSTPSRQRVDTTAFSKTLIPLPPLPEQKAIARVLSIIQKAVEKQDKIIAATRELKKSLMKHLFTYGPMPVSEAEKVPLKETEIGPVPEHWEVVRLGDLTSEEIRNGAFVRRNRFGDGVPFLNVADTYEHISINFRSSERVQATEDEMELYKIKPNDLFYVRSSLKREGVGQCCIVENVLKPSIYDCHLMRVRVDNNRVLPKYLSYFSVSSPGRKSLILRSKTTTMTTINQQGLASFMFPLPPYNIQQEIVNILANLDTKIETDEKRKSALQALFKTMLHLLMSGKVRVKELEATAI